MNPTTFTELNLLPNLQKAITEENYTTPTPIQAEAIPHLLNGRDLFGCAQTGTGKTAAFALPILHHIGKENQKSIPKTPLALILAPTRELAAQIDESFRTYGRHLHLRQTVVFGGVSQVRQVRSLSRGCHILVATPGRLLDLMNQGHIKLNQLQLFVLDEADRMLDMGFLPDLKKIMASLPENRQSLFFSATVPPRVLDLSHSLLNNPVHVTVTPTSSAVEKIAQRVLFVAQAKKADLLINILNDPEVTRAIVFARTKRGADALSEKLRRANINSGAIHGDKTQGARQRMLASFRANKIRVLVATDVAARGIDIDGISHVINFEIPNESESYVHRIGRTGRAGATGTALTFCSRSEVGSLRAIERLIGTKIPVHADHANSSAAFEASKSSSSRYSKSRGNNSYNGNGPRSGNGSRGNSSHGNSGNSSRKRNFRSRDSQSENSENKQSYEGNSYGQGTGSSGKRPARKRPATKKPPYRQRDNQQRDNQQQDGQQENRPPRNRTTESTENRTGNRTANGNKNRSRTENQNRTRSRNDSAQTGQKRQSRTNDHSQQNRSASRHPAQEAAVVVRKKTRKSRARNNIEPVPTVD